MNIGNKNKITKRKIKPWILIGIVGLVLLVIAILFIKKGFGNKDNNTIDLEGQMTTMVSSFYDKNIKGKVIGINRQIVTLEDLQSQDYDITDFVTSECSLESFSYVILEDPNEEEVTKIKYTVENYLDCKE